MRKWIHALLLLVCLGANTAAAAVRIDIQRPADREFVRDTVGMLREDDKRKIVELADKLLTDQATPIIVVTIDSMANHGGEGLRIETFARVLFDQWQVGIANLNGKSWNTGILLLVSRDDRKARIELGGGWGHERDDLCTRIMAEQIIPRFRGGDYAGGIVNGVVALDAMARDKPLPRPHRPLWHLLVPAALAGLLIFTGISLWRSGSRGWAWVFWGVVFAIIGTILYQAITSRGRSSGGSGYSGGSFGGGFSGGGGATGSW